MCPCSLAIRENIVAFPYPIAALLPQSQTMMLLDRVLEAGESHIITELKVRDDGWFSGSEHTAPAWLGLEYMAQTIAAFSGFQRKIRGEEIGLGFLLGTRYYTCSVDCFPCGARLQVRANKIIEASNDMSVFSCTLEGDNISASSQLNVLLPRDAKKFLKAKGI